MHPITITENDVRFEFARSGGAGGQNVNKRSTQAILYFPISKSHKLTPEQKKLLLCHNCTVSNNQMLQKVWNRIDGAGNLIIRASNERTQEANRAQALHILNYELTEALKSPEPRITKIPVKIKAKRKAVAQKRKVLAYKKAKLMK